MEVRLSRLLVLLLGHGVASSVLVGVGFECGGRTRSTASKSETFTVLPGALLLRVERVTSLDPARLQNGLSRCRTTP